MPTRPAPATGSQTLSRGIRILEILAAANNPMTTDDVAAALEVHRSIAYRLLRTLQDHGLVIRDAAGHLELGPRLAALAATVARDLQSAAMPELTAVANEFALTAFIATLDGEDCVTIATVEPRHTVATMVQRPGAQHRLDMGATGRAMLMQLPEADWPATVTAAMRDEIRAAGTHGYVTSHNEVIPNTQAVSAPLRLRGERPATLGVVYVDTEFSAAQIGERLVEAAASIRDAMGG